MKILTALAAAATVALVCGASAFGGDQAKQDTGGIGGPGMGGFGAPMANGSTMAENPFFTAKRLIGHGNYAEAIPYLDEALRRQPGNGKYKIYEGLANTKVGEYGTALDYLKQAIADDADNEDAHQYLGELYLAMHNLNGANAQLAELNRICSSGCEGKDALTSDIAAYQGTTASAAPATKAQ